MKLSTLASVALIALTSLTATAKAADASPYDPWASDVAPKGARVCAMEKVNMRENLVLPSGISGFESVARYPFLNRPVVDQIEAGECVTHLNVLKYNRSVQGYKWALVRNDSGVHGWVAQEFFVVAY